MGTNRLPKGTTNLTVNVRKEIHTTLKRLADRSGMNLSDYCRAVLDSAMKQESKADVHYSLNPPASIPSSATNVEAAGTREIVAEFDKGGKLAARPRPPKGK